MNILFWFPVKVGGKGKGKWILFSGALYLFMLLASCKSAEASSLFIAAGAGYKKPLLEICQKFTDRTDIKVLPIFGNMQTVSEQVKQSGQVGVLIGDKSFLDNPALGVSYAGFSSIGEGKLVLAYPATAGVVTVADLLDEGIHKISIPDTKKAIYGKAAFQYLQNAGLWEKVEGKILPASTVPQVSSYLISGEVDAGFINLTDAIAIQDKIGGYRVLKEGVPRIEIVAGVVESYKDNREVLSFIDYLKDPEAVEIMEKYGL